MTSEELEIIILGSALESQKAHVQRMRRRFEAACVEFHEAQAEMEKTERDLAHMRQTYLGRIHETI